METINIGSNISRLKWEPEIWELIYKVPKWELEIWRIM